VVPPVKQYLHLLDYGLWTAIMALQWCLLVLAIRREISRILPRYVLFLAFLCFQSTWLVAVSQSLSYRWYFWSFYAGMAVEHTLLLFVVYDLFREGFAPLASLPPNTFPNLVTWLLSLVIIAVGFFVWKPGKSIDMQFALVRNLARTAQITVAGCLWAVIVYARLLRIPWRSRVAGIARGFLVYLSIQSFTSAAMSFANARSESWNMWLGRTSIVSFLVALLMWLVALRRRDVAVELPTPGSLLFLKNLVRRNREDALTLSTSPGE